MRTAEDFMPAPPHNHTILNKDAADHGVGMHTTPPLPPKLQRFLEELSFFRG
jgi:hypothetical protein